ncbi:MAG: Unknown protein [uncultured Sulfurovum sp.]|uniref:Lipoprotein n=1 Tax=uncultured Sulfurovum sp. TaxID=269237 RepID=A0A6S6S9G9_9BACT|nr:MAG: Unknown protein [uncultured Sulfurovum sp.]
MFNVFLVFIFALIFNGCANSTQSSSVTLKKEGIKIDKLQKYASNMGCKVLKNGYMVCPKSMNR